MAGGKRAASPDSQSPATKATSAPSAVDRTTVTDEGMGEFEDQWEDDLENDEDQGEVVDAFEEEGDSEEGEEAEDGEQGETEGMDVEEENARPASPIPFLPTGVLAEGEFLEPDLSTYPLLHSFVPTWPSLSFDVLRDNDGEERRGYPVSCALVAGTQAQDSTANEITIMRWEGLGRTRRDDNGKFDILLIQRES